MGALLKIFSVFNLQISAASAAVIVLSGVSALYVLLILKRNRSLEHLKKSRNAVEAFNYLDINIVTMEEDCDHVVHELRKRSMKHKTLGFDCEWVTGRAGRQPVALLQLSAFDGYCGLFRLSCFTNGTIPSSLKELLECEDIYKIGVAPNGDAKYIRSDYQTTVRAAIDVRHIVQLCGRQVGGLAAMTETILNVCLDKRFKTRCSNWEATELSPTQMHYAASDAHTAIKIFVTVMENYYKGSFKLWGFRGSNEDVWERIDEICWKYSDLSYSTKNNGKQLTEGSKKYKKAQEKEPKRLYRANAARSKPLYNNCFLQAPDGELLCTCDNKKALWYVEKNLAALISEEPLTVRLRFEPAGRSVGDVGRYYKMRKENHCVVCGNANSYIRKNIVPREYRRYFPEIMKDHSSHDVLLLCVPCHQLSNMQDQLQRRRLADACFAPFTHDPKVIEDAAIKKVRMAARALLVHGRKHSLPAERRKELEAVVMSQFPDQDKITNSMLQEASTMQQSIFNEDFTAESHGYKVVSKYLASPGGLLKLEEEWRTHFLTSMRPKFMPDLWSIHHNRDRLKIKWDENRLDANDLKAMGVEW